MNAPRQVDVAIVGGGLAGLLLALQLQRARPGLSIAVFERARERTRKVGESTVEIATNYLLRRLRLSTYLYERHLPKNGLRFFFDTPGRDAELTQMSEIGSHGLPLLPTFQVDRARLETDLMVMLEERGVDLRCGVKVVEVALGEGRDRHRVTLEDDATREVYTCRWLVDASGRASVLARQQRLRVPEAHALAAVWGRVTGLEDLDAHPDEAWRARVRHTSRLLSTNHFCYPGYWIWLIPVGEGVTSVGVVCERGRFRDAVRRRDGFLAFLREHAAVRSLLTRVDLLDIGSLGQVSYGTKRFFSPGRWGLTGEAGAFTDPFYSPGSDFIALANDFLSALICADLDGEDIEERCAAYDEYMQFRYEATMLLYRDLYATLASYELYRLKWNFDIACYYNLWLAPYMLDEHLPVKAIASELRRKELVLQALRNFSRLFQTLEGELRGRGQLHRHNLGQFYYGIAHIDWLEQIHGPRRRKDVLRTTERIFNGVRGEAVAILDGLRGEKSEPRLPLYEFMLDRSLS